MDEITVVWSFRNRPEVLKKSIETADRFSPKNINFCLVDGASDDEVIKDLRLFCNEIEGRKIRICESAYRTSLAEAWNLGMMLSETRYVIFASSDVVFKSDWCFTVLKRAFDQGGEYVLVGNHAVFGIDKKAIPKMGWFDEGFVNGPHFDVDYMIRANENKVQFGIAGINHSYEHSDTAEESIERSTKGIKDRLPMDTLDNEIYFQKKWQSSWAGWKNHLDQVDKPHPPTTISQVTRMFSETDPHPSYTKKWIS
jgi:glycosyltransferase involved in cell wall biosynthesis